MLLKALLLLNVFSPLVGTLVTLGVGCRKNKPKPLKITLFCVLCLLISTLAASLIALEVFGTNAVHSQVGLYNWASYPGGQIQFGFYLDRISSAMIGIISFIALMVHIYSLGYMKDDPGIVRFFSLIGFFTFAMLWLVLSQDLVQLFLGWEGVGLASYLLIGFWYEKPSASFASLKAFLLNRIGDLGFLIGIAAVFYVFGTFSYRDIFAQIPLLSESQKTYLPVISLALFIGAMGKSAQMPLHVWLPDSMVGPTPISALIHAATMVTAGVFMLARFAPLFEFTPEILQLIACIGAATCFFMGIVAVAQNDMKRIIAYSTLSQLGLMMVAIGLSAYGLALFHLITHAFFKALLFLGAGSVILACRHEQDIRNLGGLRKKLPKTYWTMLIATLSMIGFPGFSGFYSKESIIELASREIGPLNQVIYYAVLSSVFLTSLYSFRLLFSVFHGNDCENTQAVCEKNSVITWPLVILSFPAFGIGAFCYSAVIQNVFHFPKTVYFNEMSVLGKMVHGFVEMPFVLLLLGFMVACYQKDWKLPKGGFDWVYEKIMLPLIQHFARFSSEIADNRFIDRFFVNGCAHCVGLTGSFLRQLQTGKLYHYVFFMLLSLFLALLWVLLP